ncbi:nucleoside triphosphate pyrophosphatase [Nevskia sp.]|uniref:Maf family protein n=1 Tax=Nevskia sp. TaxID=1929292 RepID=UPI0025D2B194|nr:nucleoside triphosphate pyrophosphatase [Nevskia sp.]
MSVQLYLASRSPRRAEFLAALGVSHAVIAADVPEQPKPGQSPLAYALETATAKARAGAAHARLPIPVLGADTDVAIDGVILGKPRDADDAVAMLMRLAGRSHQVVSAVAVVAGERLETIWTITEVVFGAIAAADARAYAASGEPLDKAGAYGIQGHAARWVRRIEGSYTGVVGLPLYETAELLGRFGVGTGLPRALPISPRSQ